MGFFDFFKRKDAPKAPPPEPAVEPEPAPDPRSLLRIPSELKAPIMELASILTGGDQVAVDGLGLFIDDEEAFAAAYPEWYRDRTGWAMWTTDDEKTQTVFWWWLVRNNEVGFSYGLYIDRKQEANAAMSTLQEIADSLGYPVRPEDLGIPEDDEGLWEERLIVVDAHLSEHGYSLVPMYDGWTGWYLFLAPEDQMNRVYELARQIGFDTSYPL